MKILIKNRQGGPKREEIGKDVCRIEGGGVRKMVNNSDIHA